MPRGRSRTIGAALAAAVGLALVPGLPTSAASAASAAVAVNRDAAATQCEMSFGGASPTDAKKAAELMRGRADLDEYGWFHLAKNPSWRPVATLDSSGKGHMHSLHYLLPLLREGVRTGNRPMVARFYAVLKDWVHDNPPGASTRRYAWGPPIYEGFRAQVLVCAAAGPRGHQKWLAKSLRLHGRQMSDPRRYEGINNASLHQAMGLYSIAKTLRRGSWRDVAIARERSLAVRLIHLDGSDEEGAPGYGINNYRWFRQAAERLRRGGDPVPPELGRVDQIPAFIAQATRPNGRIEAIGDTSAYRLTKSTWRGTAAEFSATRGNFGTAPAATFGAFEGGYVFGRSGWGTARELADETFYSVRAGRVSGIPHAHDDVGSVTLFANRAPVLLDTGQWRYTYGTTRSFVISHAAHNVVVVDGARRSRQGTPQWSASTSGGLDVSTVVDRGYSGVTITRTVVYDRAEDALLVWDRLESAKQVRASQQWGLERTRGVTLGADAAHTTGPDGNVSLLFTSGGSPLDVAKGKKHPMRGWSSKSYGELSPSPSVRATQSGTSLSWLTVIAPRAPGVAASTVSATSSVSSTAASVDLKTPSGSALVTLDSFGASRSAPSDVAPSVSPVAGTVLAGSSTTLRVRGLAPNRPVTLDSMPVGATGFSPAGSTTASAAGTAAFRVPVGTTAQFRARSGNLSSASAQVIAAVAPAAPPIVSATTTRRGTVTVTWDPPASDGGSPLTRYLVRVDGERHVVDPSSGSLRVGKVVPGSQPVMVRAANVVAESAWTRATIDVPAYPTIQGPKKVRKRHAVVLSLRGLLPGERASVVLLPAKAGDVRTRRVVGNHAGMASVTVLVKRTLRVAVTSGGVRSSPHRVRVR